MISNYSTNDKKQMKFLSCSSIPLIIGICFKCFPVAGTRLMFLILMSHCGLGLSTPFIGAEWMNHSSILCIFLIFSLFFLDSINVFKSLLMYSSSMDKINGFCIILSCLNNTGVLALTNTVE